MLVGPVTHTKVPGSLGVAFADVFQCPKKCFDGRSAGVLQSLVAARKSMARKKANKRELVDSFFEEYRRLWREKYGRQSVIKTNVKRVQGVIEIIETAGVVDLFDGLREYFVDKSAWYLLTEHPIDLFLKYPERFVGRKNGKAKSDRAKAEQKAGQAKQDGNRRETIDQYLERIELEQSRQEETLRELQRRELESRGGRPRMGEEEIDDLVD